MRQIHVIETPRFVNKRYRIAGLRRKKGSAGLRFAGCQEGRLIYSQDLDIRELVPAVAFRDSSGRAFGEYVDFSYEVNGSALQLNAHGAIGFNFGLDVRIS
jgi:hypothetical protein